MFNRLLKTTKNNSFFLFGARSTGKTSLVRELFTPKDALFIDLLDPAEYRLFLSGPHELKARIDQMEARKKWVIIDEVQRVPALLDIVHQESLLSAKQFVLTGSSARKLKRGAANLLAGRAFVYHLYPLTCAELGDIFSLDYVLNWGSLPQVFSFDNDIDRRDFLDAYAHTYLREEIVSEQLVRGIEPFNRFLAVAAQMSGKIINYANVARDSGVSTPTAQTYFQILEDTLVGAKLLPYHESIRKRQSGNPKFYFFDNGVCRALSQTLTIPVLPQSYGYGNAFESFVINEIMRLNHYKRRDYNLSYLRTKSRLEIDLIVEKPAKKVAAIEIKSTDQIRKEDLRRFVTLGSSIENCELFCFSRDPHPKKIDNVLCLPWYEWLIELGLV